MTLDDVEHFISELRTEADFSRFSDLAEPAITRAIRAPRLSLLRRLRNRTAAVTAAAVVAVGGFSGVAFAANGAAPGDALYGVDRALESIGIGNGGTAERLAEVDALVQRGQDDTALQHATDLVEGDAGAQAALLAAAERIGASDDVVAHEGVAALLSYLAANVGSVDGPTVSELARAINGDHVPGPPEGVTPGPPEGVTPGPPEGVTPGGPQNP